MDTAQKKVWQQAKNEVRHLTDRRGMSVDPGILETVAAFRLLGINTTSSCAGHTERTSSGPYVAFVSVQTREYERQAQDIGDSSNREYKQLRQKAIESNIREMQKILPYLDQFYTNREVPYNQRLIIKNVGPIASYLMCQGADLMYIADKEQRKKILSNNRAEMRAFTEYLKLQTLSQN